jgi:hypothetical protein
MPLQGVQARVVWVDRKWLGLIRVIKGRLKQAGVSHFSLERAFLCSFRIQVKGLHDCSGRR